MSGLTLERWLAGLKDRRVEDTDVPDDLCARVRLWAELTPALPAGAAGAWLLWREDKTMRAAPVGSDGTVGRGDDAGIRIPYRFLSRRHFAIRPVAGGHEVVTLAAKNDLLVNGRSVSSDPLQSGDILRVGDLELLFLVAP